MVEKTYDFLLWLFPKVEKFPRSFRFSVGDRAVALGLDLLQSLVEAAYSAEKTELLQSANRRANGLRYVMRLAKDLRLLTTDSYAFAAGRLEEIGKGSADRRFCGLRLFVGAGKRADLKNAARATWCDRVTNPIANPKLKASVPLFRSSVTHSCRRGPLAHGESHE